VTSSVGAIAARLGDAALVFDLDGTLAPIVPDPASARPLPALLPPLAALTRRARVVAVVTGRPSAFAREVLDLPGVEVIGTYGLEDRPPIHPSVLAELRNAADVTPGALLEPKGATVSVHVRHVRPEDAAWLRSIVASIGHDAGLEAFEGKQVIELAPPGPRKQQAVRALLARTTPAAAMYAGDDLEDVGAFDALALVDGPTLRVAVAGSETPGELLGAADMIVEGPAGLHDLLVELLRTAGGGDVDVP
jgi:trehalose 6-phosphate phosphatase